MKSYFRKVLEEGPIEIIGSVLVVVLTFIYAYLKLSGYLNVYNFDNILRFSIAEFIQLIILILFYSYFIIKYYKWEKYTCAYFRNCKKWNGLLHIRTVLIVNAIILFNHFIIGDRFGDNRWITLIYVIIVILLYEIFIFFRAHILPSFRFSKNNIRTSLVVNIIITECILLTYLIDINWLKSTDNVPLSITLLLLILIPIFLCLSKIKDPSIHCLLNNLLYSTTSERENIYKKESHYYFCVSVLILIGCIVSKEIMDNNLFNKKFENDEFGIVIAKFDNITESLGFGSDLANISIQKYAEASILNYIFQCDYINNYDESSKNNKIVPKIVKFNKTVDYDLDDKFVKIFNCKLLIWGQGIETLSNTTISYSEQDIFYFQTYNIDKLLKRAKEIFEVLGRNELKGELFREEYQLFFKIVKNISQKTQISRKPECLEISVLIIEALMIINNISKADIENMDKIALENIKEKLFDCYRCLKEAYIKTSLMNIKQFEYGPDSTFKYDLTYKRHLDNIQLAIQDMLAMIYYNILGITTAEKRMEISNIYKVILEDAEKIISINLNCDKKLCNKVKEFIMAKQKIDAIIRSDPLEESEYIKEQYSQIIEVIDKVDLSDTQEIRLFLKIGLAYASKSGSNRNDLTLAEENLFRAHRIDPSDANIRIKLALVKNALRKYEEARKLLDEIYRIDLYKEEFENLKIEDKQIINEIMSQVLFAYADGYYKQYTTNIDSLSKCLNLVDTATTRDPDNWLAYELIGDSGKKIAAIAEDEQQRRNSIDRSINGYFNAMIGHCYLVGGYDSTAYDILNNKIDDLIKISMSSPDDSILVSNIISAYDTFKNEKQKVVKAEGINDIFNDLERSYPLFRKL